MSVGRKPIPSNLKVFRGTERKDRKKNEPKPEAGIPRCPPHLSDEAKLEWARISPELYTLGLLRKIDRAALVGYCEAWSDYKAATEKVAQLGMVIKTGERITEKTNKDGTVTKAELMEMRGRSMKGWLRVADEDVRTKPQLRKWAELGTAYARSLPPK